MCAEVEGTEMNHEILNCELSEVLVHLLGAIKKMDTEEIAITHFVLPS
jgi:hypothetical protein